MKCFVGVMLRDWRWMLLGIFVTAFLLRVTFTLTLQDGFYFPDSIEYSNAAVNILQNGELGENYHRPPGYPVFLATIYFLFGENILGIRLVESFVSALLAVIIALIGKRIGGDVVGGLAGLLWSIYPLGIFISTLVYPTNLVAMLLACGVLFLLPSSQKELSTQRVFLAGLFWGVATLTIPIVLATLSATAVWLTLVVRAKRLVLAFVLLVGAALTVVPWTIRNFYVYGQIVPVEPRVIEHLPRIRTGAENVPGGMILKHPGLFVSHFVGEFFHFWKLYPDRITMDKPGFREQQHEKDDRVVKSTMFSAGNLIKAVSILTTGPIFVFAIIGTVAICFQRQRRRDLLLLWAVILSFAVGYSAFYTKTRHRIPIEPYIIILSAYGLKRFWDLLASHVFHGMSSLTAEIKV
jgi:4-amino-4-deoxy-L-arabinose transferase-like glycosyltransferase